MREINTADIQSSDLGSTPDIDIVDEIVDGRDIEIDFGGLSFSTGADLVWAKGVIADIINETAPGDRIHVTFGE